MTFKFRRFQNVVFKWTLLIEKMVRFMIRMFNYNDRNHREKHLEVDHSSGEQNKNFVFCLVKRCLLLAQGIYPWIIRAVVFFVLLFYSLSFANNKAY